MFPKPHTQPAWLPLRLIVLSAALSCAILSWHQFPAAGLPRFLVGLNVVGADGTTLATAMGSRIGTTLMLVLASVLIAVMAGFAVAFTALRLGCGLPWLAGVFGRLLASLPVVAIGWMAVGWIVGEKGWPIESLLPHHPAPGRDTWELALGRRLWWWLVPCWALTVPLAGEFISQTLDRFAQIKQSELLEGLRARGLKRSEIHYHHSFPVAWPDLLDFIQALGLLALGYVVFIEEALGIPGWGAFFAGAVKSGDVPGIASSIYIFGWAAAAWCLCIGLLRRLTTHRAGPAPAPDSSSKTIAAKPAATAAPVLLLLVLSCCAFGEMPALTTAASILGEYVSPLVHDLRVVTAACAVALVLALIRGGLPAIVGWRVPHTGLLETLSWSPLLVWTVALTALMKDSDFVWIVPGIAAAFGGGVQIRNRWRELQSSRAIDGSRAVGTGTIAAWRMHVLPGLFSHALSWILEVSATLLVWVTLIDSLKLPGTSKTAESLGLAISAAKENVLSDLPSLIVPAFVVAISALFFHQLSRIVRPGPPPH